MVSHGTSSCSERIKNRGGAEKICAALKESAFEHGKAPLLEELAELTALVRRAAEKKAQVSLSIS